jgi:serine phosphatase RsbU (regulator of sigma subunit)/Tfp pilus assembly protein PilF
MKSIQDTYYTLKGVVKRLIITASFRLWTIALIFIIFNLSFVIVKSQLNGQAKIDSLQKELPKAKNDTNKVKLFLELANDYFEFDLQKYFNFSNNSLNLSENLSWDIGKGKSFTNIAIYYMELEEFDKSIVEFNKALKVYQKLGLEENQAKILTSLGNLKETKGEYVASLDYHIKSLKLNTKLKREEGISINLSNIGIVYWALGYDTLALNYFQKAIKLEKKLNRKFGMAANFGNIGMVYQKWNIDTLAYINYKKAIDIAYEINDEYGQALNHRNIGIIFTNYGNFDSAFSHLNISYILEKKLKNKQGLAETLTRYGILEYAITVDSIRTKIKGNKKYYKNKNYHYLKALSYIDSSLTLFTELNTLSGSIIIYKFKSQILMEMKNFESSLLSYINYNTLKDSIFSIENSLKINTLEAKYQNDLKEQDFQNLNRKRKEKENYLILSISILIIAFVIAFLRFREKKKLSDELQTQKSIVEEKNQEIISSITYASTIQHAILPWESTLQKAFSDIFIFYKPKDIVSGDSYWFHEVDGIKFLAVIDCTGHGIPGAMLTVIASSVLDDAVLSKKFTDTGDILTFMNEKVTEVLNQKLAENKIRDGMEVALIAIHHDKIQFSGAGRPLYLKNRTIEIIKTDKRGIAGSSTDEEYKFSSIEIDRNSELIIYLSSDGFADQMNESSKKYSTKRFISILDSISEVPLEKQKEIIENEFNNHKGERSQIDDITILGVRI